MNNNWSPETINVKELEKKMSNGEIAVPAYQRGIVWDDQMQKDLIDSIKRGYPFGSLIMYNYEDDKKPLLLIDGLQRSTALFKFVRDPSNYFEKKDIPKEVIDKLINVLGFNNPSESLKKQLCMILVEWINNLSGRESIKNLDMYKCAKHIVNSISFPERDSNDFNYISSVKSVIEPAIQNYKNICSEILDREIPYIEITGDPYCLQTIFYRINDKGKKLTKENIFAATWANRAIKISNDNLKEFIKIVAERYDSIQSGGTSIFGYDHQKFIDKGELDIFELCHAFGKYIKRKYSDLFGKTNDIIKTDSIGFTLLNACLLGTKETLPKMNELFLKTFNNDEKINTFVVKVLSCIKYVDGILAPILKFKSNKRIGGKPLHTDFQIVSIIASIFRMKHIEKNSSEEYVFNLSSTNHNWNEYDILLQKNLVRRYLYDTISNVWAGHGDNTLDNIIHDSNYDYYTREILRADLKSALNNWYKMYKINNKELTEKDIKAPSNADKILMNIIYSESFTARMQLSEARFDIEHLFPKKLAARMLNNYGGELKLSLSSIGNLCLLPESPNRKKKDKIIYDDKQYTNKLGEKITIEELEENYTFTTEEQLSWTKKNDISKEELEKQYDKFIDDRFDTIIDKVLNTLYPNSNN